MVIGYCLLFIVYWLCISLSRARLRLSQFRIRLSLSWLSLSRAPTGLTFSLTLQVWCKVNAEASSLGLCWAAAHIRRCISNATAKVWNNQTHSKFNVQKPPFFDPIFRPNFANKSKFVSLHRERREPARTKHYVMDENKLIDGADVFKDSIKHDFRSPCYTTRWSDIPEAEWTYSKLTL